MKLRTTKWFTSRKVYQSSFFAFRLPPPAANLRSLTLPAAFRSPAFAQHAATFSQHAATFRASLQAAVSHIPFSSRLLFSITPLPPPQVRSHPRSESKSEGLQPAPNKLSPGRCWPHLIPPVSASPCLQRSHRLLQSRIKWRLSPLTVSPPLPLPLPLPLLPAFCPSRSSLRDIQ